MCGSHPLRGIKLRIVSFVVVAMFLLAGSGLAASDPLGQMKDMVDRAMVVLNDPALAGTEHHEERRQRIMAMVTEHFDFRSMAQSVLARHWQERTPAEQEHFISLFSRLVERVYVDKGMEQYSGQKVVFRNQLVKGDRALVESVVVDNGTEIPVSYKLRERGGRWSVYDVRIEGVSMVANYRSQFANSKSYAEVLAWLENAVASGRVD